MDQQSLDKMLEERGRTHGNYIDDSRGAMEVRRVMERNGLDDLPMYKQHALQMISVKIGRILAGDHNEVDHWADIAGYAQLVMDYQPKFNSNEEKSDGSI